MTAEEFSKRLSESEPGSPQASTLARDLVNEARYPAFFVLQHYLFSTGESDQLKAKNLLAGLRELALEPLSKTENIGNIDTELWVMRTLTAESVALRNRVAVVLKDLLANFAVATPPPVTLSPSNPPDTRVCDLAFVLLHRVLHLAPQPAFLEIPSAERTRRIEEFQKSRPFRAAFEPES
jgi:hypothetical protein